MKRDRSHARVFDEAVREREAALLTSAQPRAQLR